MIVASVADLIAMSCFFQRRRGVMMGGGRCGFIAMLDLAGAGQCELACQHHQQQAGDASLHPDVRLRVCRYSAPEASSSRSAPAGSGYATA